MTRHIFYFDPLRFTATKRSHSRHPEPDPLARLAKDPRMARTVSISENNYVP